MGKVIVVQFVTLDGIVEDPDGSAGMDGGGWAFHAGPDVFAGDKFALGPIMTTGAMLLGRSTWEMFAGRWPGRSGEFADAMNAIAKIVVTHRAPDLDAWNNSSLLNGDLIDETKRLAADRDVVVVGSISVVHQLAAADAVDEYRLLTVPLAIGSGTPLFTSAVSLRQVSVEPADTMVLTTYERVRLLVPTPAS